MKITSRNINGIRAVAEKGFLDRVKADNADIICLQEPKAFLHQVPAEVNAALAGYHCIRHAGTRPGYAGTAIYSRIAPTSTQVVFEECVMFHEDGRVTQAVFGNIALLNIYFPNGGDRADGREMLTYKLGFYDALFEHLAKLRAQGLSVIVCGDLNIVHTEIDIARPKENAGSIGFLPVERAKISEFLGLGYCDVRRCKNPDTLDTYSRRSYRAGARPNNVGRRIDYFVVSQDLLDKITNIEYQTQQMGSDHCPISMTLAI